MYLHAMASPKPSVLTGIIAALATTADIFLDHGLSGDERLSKAEHDVPHANSIGPRRRKPRHHRMDKGELRNALSELQSILHITSTITIGRFSDEDLRRRAREG
jgi:hypothetical protein